MSVNHHYELDRAVHNREFGLTIEHARQVALAYLVAFTFALLDYIERTTGRRDHEDFTGLVQPDDPIMQELWRAKATSDEARQFAHDTELMHSVARDCPGLAALAEDYATRLLAWCRADLLQE
jgi:hypothetical protein